MGAAVFICIDRERHQMPALGQKRAIAFELREAYGVRGACSRFRMFESVRPRQGQSTAGASSTHSIRFARFERNSTPLYRSWHWTLSLGHPVERAVYHIHLLFAGQTHKVHGITRDADREGGIFFRVIHRVEQHPATEHVHVDMTSIPCDEEL